MAVLSEDVREDQIIAGPSICEAISVGSDRANVPEPWELCRNQYICRYSTDMEKKIHRKTVSKGIEIRHACEVGVFLPEMSNILDFIVTARIRTTLVEPDPKCIEAIRTYFAGYNNVKLEPCAVYDYHGVLELVQREASTFVSDLPYSPGADQR